MNRSKTAAVIPFFNEAKTIRQIVQSVLTYVDFVIAVDDGSTDNSSDQIKDFQNVHIISVVKNTGKGLALRNGFQKALELSFEKIVSIDADLQHPPELIPALLEQLNYYDIVIGNRMNDTSSMPVQRILSNKLTSLIISKKIHQKIPDSQCGFRAFNSVVLKSVKTNFNGYEAESEILIFAGRNGFKIGSYPVPTIYNYSKSKMNPFKAILGFIKVIFL